jgi:hypothetical protein
MQLVYGTSGILSSAYFEFNSARHSNNRKLGLLISAVFRGSGVARPKLGKRPSELDCITLTVVADCGADIRLLGRIFGPSQ